MNDEEQFKFCCRHAGREVCISDNSSLVRIRKDIKYRLVGYRKYMGAIVENKEARLVAFSNNNIFINTTFEFNLIKEGNKYWFVKDARHGYYINIDNIIKEKNITKEEIEYLNDVLGI